MNACYTLKICTEFAAAHTLREYPGACSRMHGHNWKVEVEVVAHTLDNTGMGVDFRDIKQFTRDVTDRLDHRYLNELKPFDEINPTAENIACWIYSELETKLNNDRVKVSAVTLWETDRACVRYTQG